MEGIDSIKISQRFIPNSPFSNIPACGSDNGLAPTRRLAIIWTNADLIQWRIYAALGGNELADSHQPHAKLILRG